MERGLLIVSGGVDGGGDRRPEALMSDMGRLGFFMVLEERKALSSWPDEPFDVVMISPGCTDCAPLLEECLERGQLNVIVGSPHCGSARVFDLVKMIRSAGGRVLGPGSKGYFDWGQELALCWSSAVTVPRNSSERGHVALISQGGAMAFSLYAMAVEAGVRFRRVLSLGARQDDDALLRAVGEAIDDSETRLLILSLESLRRGRDFLALASRASARGLPVVLLRSGVSEQLRKRVDARHPDGSWTDEVMWESVASQFGVVLLDDVQQMVDLGKLFGLTHRAEGNRVAVLASSEGLAYMQSDHCTAAGLNVVPFSAKLRGRIQKYLPAWGCADNPADLSERVLKENGLLEKILEELQRSDEFDMILVIAGSMTPSQGERFARALVTSHRLGRKPMACCCLSKWRPLEEMVRRMNDAGVPLFSSPCRVADALAFFWKLDRPRHLLSGECRPAEHPMLDALPSQLSEKNAIDLVGAYGLKTVEHRFCTSVSDVLEAAQEIGFPLVLKVVSPSFASKQQARAVALNLRTEEELRNAYGRILERVSRVHPDAVIEGVFAQKMITDGIECMIGIKRDPLFGPVVAVALGGAFYGLMKDISLRAAPVSIEVAHDMIASLKGYPLLSGAWSGVSMDVAALARQIVTLSHMGCAEPDIELLDINPIFIRPQGAEIADAFAVRRKGGTPHRKECNCS